MKIKTKQRVRRREEIYHTQSGGRASARLRTRGVAYRISFFNRALCADTVRKTHNSPTEAAEAARVSFSFSSRTACSISSVLFCHLHNSFPVWVLFLETSFLSRCRIKKCRKNVTRLEQEQALKHQQNVTSVIFWTADVKPVFSAR